MGKKDKAKAILAKCSVCEKWGWADYHFCLGKKKKNLTKGDK